MLSPLLWLGRCCASQHTVGSHVLHCCCGWKRTVVQDILLCYGCKRNCSLASHRHFWSCSVIQRHLPWSEVPGQPRPVKSKAKDMSMREAGHWDTKGLGLPTADICALSSLPSASPSHVLQCDSSIEWSVIASVCVCVLLCICSFGMTVCTCSV